MEVKAIQGLSLMNQSTGSLKKSNNTSAVQNYAQMDSPMSKNAAEAIKNNSMVSFGQKKNSNAMRNAAMATAASAMVLGSLNSCKVINDGCNSCKPTIYVVCNKCDKDTTKTDTTKTDTTKTDTTKHDTIPDKQEPFKYHIPDSLTAHFTEIGGILTGTLPKDSNNHVIFRSGKFYNEYDQHLYETEVVKGRNSDNPNEVTLITKVTDKYERYNPKVSYVKSIVKPLFGIGMNFENYEISNDRLGGSSEAPKASDSRWQFAGTEVHVRKHGAVEVYSATPYGDMLALEPVRVFRKGMKEGTGFIEKEQVFIDPDTGEEIPETIRYNLSGIEAKTEEISEEDYKAGNY